MVSVGMSARGAVMSAAIIEHCYPFPSRSSADYAAFGARAGDADTAWQIPPRASSASCGSPPLHMMCVDQAGIGLSPQ